MYDEVQGVPTADYMRQLSEAMAGLISPWAKDSLDLYVKERAHPGDFLIAILNNDLKEACARADDIEKHNIFETVKYCYNKLPANCWGDPERVRRWLSRADESKGPDAGDGVLPV